VGPIDVQQEPRPTARTRRAGVAFNETVETARERGYLSGEHFSVDGTLIQARSGHKSFVPKASPDDDDRLPDEPPAPNDNWHEQKGSNETPSPQPTNRRACFTRAMEPERCSVIWTMC
jgi:hypothetical protein